MDRIKFLRGWLILALLVSGCSIALEQPPAETATPAPAAPLEPTQISVTWAHLNLKGRLVYIIGAIDQNNNYRVHIQSLDLATGEVATVYRTPVNGWIYHIAVSPDSRHVVMSYSPPPGEDPNIVQALYVLPLDGSREPELLFKPRIREDQYLQAEWAPDGKYIYYAHVNYRFPEDPHRRYPLYTIFRREYPGGDEQRVAEAAYWPRLSADSTRLVYIGVDPFSITHQLTIADADGGNPQPVEISGPYVPDIKDAPLFAPDGASIIFSGALPVQAYRPNWLEAFMGLRIARANGGIPSDWWSVPAEGGEIKQLTHLRNSGLYGSLSPDGEYMASFSSGGIFVMKPDGSEVTLLVPNLDGFSGTVSWIP